MQRNVSHVTVQLACTRPREIAFQLQIVVRALMADAGISQHSNTLCFDYGGGVGHVRFTYEGDDHVD